MRHKPTTDPEQKRLLLRTEGGNNFFIDKEKNCRATIFIEYFCPQSRYTQATVYVCVGLCVWLASILSMSEVCAKGYKTVYTATTRAGRPAGSPPHKILLTPIFVQLFSNNFVMRFACHAPCTHKSWLGCHKCLHFGSCCCAAKVFLAQVAQFPLDSPPFPPLSHSFSVFLLLVYWFDLMPNFCIASASAATSLGERGCVLPAQSISCFTPQSKVRAAE